MQPKMRMFHISDILSATTRCLVSTRGLQGLQEILEFVTGGNVMTHQIHEIMPECQRFLSAQFPYLSLQNDGLRACLDQLKLMAQALDKEERYNEKLPFIEAFIKGAQAHADPHQELPDELPVFSMVMMDWPTPPMSDPIQSLIDRTGQERAFVVEMDLKKTTPCSKTPEICPAATV